MISEKTLTVREKISDSERNHCQGECGSQRVGARGWGGGEASPGGSHCSLDIPPQSKEGAWSASGSHSSSPQGWAGGPVWRWAGRGSFLWKVPLLRKKHQKRREVDGFGTCLASTKWTCGETAGGRDGSGARRTLRFLAELEAWHPRRERNTVSAQILRRNHKSPPKVLSPELFGK